MITKGHYRTPEDVASILGTVDTYLRWRESNKEERKYKTYHPSAFGKAQPLDAIIQTPYGPKKMGDIKVGDKICGVDGDIVFVEAIYHRGVLPIYRVEFSDGDYTECSLDHLWEVNSIYMGFKKSKVLPLKQIYENYISKSGHRHYQVKVPKPLHMYNQWSSSISPYTLGVLIGDGCFRCNGPMLTGNDKDIIDRVSMELPDGVKVASRNDYMQHWLSGINDDRKNIIKTELVRLGLWGIKTYDRFIPDLLLYCEVEARWNLLKGLMDSDGTVSKKGHPSFATTSLVLSEQVAWLVKSLGGLVRTYKKFSKFNKKKNGSVCYTLHIAHSEPEKMFHLSRKKERAIIQNGRRVNRNIKNIEKICDKECQCITVSDENGLYLTDDCIVTHNCLRLMQYRKYADAGYISSSEEELDSRMIRLFEKGHNMQSRWERYFTNMGVLRGIWVCADPYCIRHDSSGDYKRSLSGPPREYGKEDIIGGFKPDKCECGCKKFHYKEISVKSQELNIFGHADFILDFSKFDFSKFDEVFKSFNENNLPSRPIVVDMKTINIKGFESLIDFGMPPSLGYQIQLIIYTHLLDCEYGLLVYECKNDSNIKAYKIERDDKSWKLIQKQAKLMVEMSEITGDDGKLLCLLPPPRPTKKSCWECKNCAFKKRCHKSGIWNNAQLDKKRKDFYGHLL